MSTKVFLPIFIQIIIFKCWLYLDIVLDILNTNLLSDFFFIAIFFTDVVVNVEDNRGVSWKVKY